jgi:hypothetical protein
VEALPRDFEAPRGASRLPVVFRGASLEVFGRCADISALDAGLADAFPRAVNEQSRGVPGPSRLGRGLGDRREEGRRPQDRRRADQSRLSAVASPTAEGRKPGLEPQLRSRLGKPFGHGPHVAAATATLAPVPSASYGCLTPTTWAGSATSVVITA